MTARRLAAFAVLTLVMLLGGTQVSVAQAASGEVEIIDSVELRADGLLERSPELLSQIALSPGQPLSEEVVRRTLSNLHSTGLVAEAEVLTRHDEGGLTAVVVVRSHTWVDEVEIKGEAELKQRDLLRVVEQRAGTPLVEGRLLRSVFALQDYYWDRGFLQAKVNLDVQEQPTPKRVRVAFDVRRGERARIGKVDIEGDLGPYDLQELRSALRLQTDSEHTPRQLGNEREALRKWLVDRQHLTAEVRLPETSYDPNEHRVDLLYEVEVGPKVHVRVIGAEEKKLRRKGLLPFLDDQIYDEALLIQTCNRIRGDFQRQGYYRAQVECPQERDGEVIDLRIEVERGERYTLEKITLQGNTFAEDDALLALMRTSPKRSWLGGSGRLVDQDLEDDLDNIQDFYFLNGFSQVEVGPAEVSEDAQTLTLTVPIHEGSRQRVVELRLSGGDLDTEAIEDRLPLRPGGPFHPVLLENTLVAVRALYEENGYPAAEVTPRLDWNRDRDLVDVELEIQPGPLTSVDRIIVRGLRRTRGEVVRRFIDMEPGDPISRRRRLETESDLYRLGIFSRVDVEAAPTTDPSGRRDVIVKVEEGRRWRLGYGVSYHSDDGLGGLFSLSRANVAGHAGRLQIDLRANRNEERYRLLYDQPSIGRFKIPITYSLFRQEVDRESFSVDDLGTRVALTRDLPRARLGLTFDYRLITLTELSGSLDPSTIDRGDRDLQLASLTPNIFVDRRNDPFDPDRGWSTALQLEHAFPLLDANADFLKLFWQQTQYVPLGTFGVLAGSVRLGAIEALGSGEVIDPIVPASLASSEVPISERFFAGGRTTHRAYERDRLGIRGQTLLDCSTLEIPCEGDFEAGGNGLALVNLDYRFPIAGAFGGTVFADVGNVWSDWRDLNLDDMRAGAGLGLRYRSPIGPLRLEVGWKLDAQPGERNPVFFLSFGNPF